MSALLSLLCLGTAAATTPGGWHIQAALPETSFALRPVVVPMDDFAPVAQVTADLRLAYGPISADLQLPWVHTWDPDGSWSHSYPGQARLGLYAWAFHEHFQLGVETDFPVYRGDTPQGSWATYANEVLPSHSLATSFHTLWATENFSITARFALGVRWGPYVVDLSGTSGGSAGLLEGGGALTRHIHGPLGLVAEMELVSDRYVPLFTRALLRADLPVDQGWLVFDLGLQFPISSFVAVNNHLGESLHPCAQIHWYPVLDWPWPGNRPDS